MNDSLHTAAPRSAADSPDAHYRRGRRQFILLAAVFSALFLASMVWQFVLIQERKAALRGDGHDASTYGFDLSNLTVNRATLVGGGMAKDQTAALTDPTLVTLDNTADLKSAGARYATIDVLDRIAEGPGGAFRVVLVSADPVIGVTVNGQSRCYPLRFIRWHEIVNDTLGGTPIAVTYSPLTDSTVVFDRRIAGTTLTFGHAGLLYNSNLVLYDDRAAEGDESLWCQLATRPIAGPAVARGDALTPLPVYVGPWSEWRAAHPDTTVLVGDVRFKDRYKKDPFARAGYFEHKKLWYPVTPMPTPGNGADAPDPFTPIVAWRESGTWRWSASSAAPSIPADAPRVYSLWFAWYSIREAK